MKKFFKAISIIGTIAVSCFGILALIDKIRSRQPDTVYFDCPNDEQEQKD